MCSESWTFIWQPSVRTWYVRGRAPAAGPSCARDAAPVIADAHEAAESVTNESLPARVAAELAAELSGEAHGGRS